MAGGPSLLSRLWLIVVPTRLQALWCTVLALLILVLAQKQSLLSKLGLSADILDATQTEFQERFSAILTSPIVSQLTLVTFWALVGLGAYLICWGAYSVMVELRNEVTLNTAYTNRGRWHGPFRALAFKAASAAGLALIMGSLWYGLTFWITLFGQAISQFGVATVGLALLAPIGLSVQCYLVIVFVQLTFTPWYSEQAFTDG